MEATKGFPPTFWDKEVLGASTSSVTRDLGQHTRGAFKSRTTASLRIRGRCERRSVEGMRQSQHKDAFFHNFSTNHFVGVCGTCRPEQGSRESEIDSLKPCNEGQQIRIKPGNNGSRRGSSSRWADLCVGEVHFHFLRSDLSTLCYQSTDLEVGFTSVRACVVVGEKLVSHSDASAFQSS